MNSKTLKRAMVIFQTFVMIIPFITIIPMGIFLLISFIVWGFDIDAFLFASRLGLSFGLVAFIVFCFDKKDGLVTSKGWPK